MRSSGSYGEKLGYKLPHTVSNKHDSPEKKDPAIERDVYVKQESFDNV